MGLRLKDLPVSFLMSAALLSGCGGGSKAAPTGEVSVVEWCDEYFQPQGRILSESNVIVPSMLSSYATHLHRLIALSSAFPQELNIEADLRLMAKASRLATQALAEGQGDSAALAFLATPDVAGAVARLTTHAKNRCGPERLTSTTVGSSSTSWFQF